MGFKIEKAEVRDAEEIGAVTLSVSTSARLLLEQAACSTDDRLNWNVNWVRSEIEVCEKLGDKEDGAVALKMIEEESGKIAGFAVWGWSGEAAEVVFAAKAANPYPTASGTAIRKAFMTAMEDMESKHIPKEKHFTLCELVTSPNYQKRGIGSVLVKYGLDKADQEGKVVYLSASPMGKPVYAKQGFEEVGRMEVDLTQFGGEGSHVHVAMIRKPKV